MLMSGTSQSLGQPLHSPCPKDDPVAALTQTSAVPNWSNISSKSTPSYTTVSTPTDISSQTDDPSDIAVSVLKICPYHLSCHAVEVHTSDAWPLQSPDHKSPQTNQPSCSQSWQKVGDIKVS
jgi:hypothetical protein